MGDFIVLLLNLACALATGFVIFLLLSGAYYFV